MKFSTIILFAFFAAACDTCGRTSVDNELTGQVKKVAHKTPIFCWDNVEVDISLGVMRNGVGSMSAQDVFLTVTSAEDVKKLEAAAATGALVTVKYDEMRVNWCWHDLVIKSVAESK